MVTCHMWAHLILNWAKLKNIISLILKAVLKKRRKKKNDLEGIWIYLEENKTQREEDHTSHLWTPARFDLKLPP